jgi:hypothetical protein
MRFCNSFSTILKIPEMFSENKRHQTCCPQGKIKE